MKERTKEKLLTTAVAIWVVIIPMVELHFITEPTGSVIGELVRCFMLCLLIGVHYGLAWLALWIYEKINARW